jgi:hypothetical protein
MLLTRGLTAKPAQGALEVPGATREMQEVPVIPVMLAALDVLVAVVVVVADHRLDILQVVLHLM